MKKYLVILSISLAAMLGSGAFAQGVVVFANSGITLISTHPPPQPFGEPPVGSFYFGLLTSATAAGPFSFTGVYATNMPLWGRLGPSSYTPAVAGWAPGATMFYEVAGWSASLGTTFDPTWLTGNFSTMGQFGVSAIASGVAGGGSPVPAPPFPLFGGTGLQGFSLYSTAIPEPTSMALASMAVGALLMLRHIRPVTPNHRAALDAGRTPRFHAEPHWPGPSEHDR